MAQRTQVPQEAVDALQRGDLLAAFKSIRAQGGAVNLQSIGKVLESHARQYAEQQASARQGPPPLPHASRSMAQAKQAARDVASRAAATGPVADLRKLAHKRPPTVAMGDAPGGLRWVLVVLALLAVAAWMVLDMLG